MAMETIQADSSGQETPHRSIHRNMRRVKAIRSLYKLQNYIYTLTHIIIYMEASLNKHVNHLYIKTYPVG